MLVCSLINTIYLLLLCKMRDCVITDKQSSEIYLIKPLGTLYASTSLAQSYLGGSMLRTLYIETQTVAECDLDG
jgi:hypothetical protein